MSGFVVPARTGLDQRRAADPGASAWVSANAGSGKTKVLADRVLRLLLAGVEPARILCLTFTKAAAANMAIRVFDELGAWVALDDDDLARRLEALEGAPQPAIRRETARRLFARAVETPGGLKIETIHAFCERLLHLFPFEANVPARFEVLDEAQSQELLETASREVLGAASQGADVRLAEALSLMAREAGDEAVIGVLRAALRHKTFLREHARGPEGLEQVLAAFATLCGLAPGETVASLRRAALEDGITADEWPQIADILDAGKKTDQTRAQALRRAAAALDQDERFDAYCSVFLKREGGAFADVRFVTKSIDSALVERLREERDRVAAIRLRLNAAHAVRRTAALFTLADAVFGRVEALKNARGALDFDDLIARTLTLLRRADAAWVLYKLDAGIDHVLIDEAQDTSPEQWAILKMLVEEFTAGEGAAGRLRTLFAVGDPKQSIYGFQGAAPHEFEESRRFFHRRAEGAGLRFEDVQLTVSFRSAPEVLSAVDAVFEVPEHRAGLSFEDGAGAPVHESARPAAPGIVEIWEPELPADTRDDDAWALPVDEPETSAPSVRLARKVARTVRSWMTEGDGQGRLIPPGDVLVLVRKRGPFFEAVIRALKDAGVPVAGADRLTVGDHIAVRDLVAAGRSLLLPHDDLTLACALKSPLVGWNDDDLIRVGASRGEGVALIEAMNEAAEGGDAAAARALDLFSRWRERARARGPFGFYAWLLGPAAGRRQLVSRLGVEAGDAIDAFLALALDHERRYAPSLADFLNAFGSAKREIRRDMDAARDEVRVMTVHGAKGLEAPVVILADGGDVPNGRHDPRLIPVEVPLGRQSAVLPVWSARQQDDPAPVEEARRELRARGGEENNRLLYVAMTRARDRLVVAPFLARAPSAESGEEAAEGMSAMPSAAEGHGAFAMPPRSWTGMIAAGLRRVAPAATRLIHEQDSRPDSLAPGVLRWLSPDKPSAEPVAMSAERHEAQPTPVWLFSRADAEPEKLPPLSPSSALAAADRTHRPLDTPFVAQARLRGQLVHALLERLPSLPAETRRHAAMHFVAARAAAMTDAERAAIVDATEAVLSAPALAVLFGPASRAEVAIAGHVSLPGRSERVPVAGRIDRLAMTGDAIHLADFKTAAMPPAGGVVNRPEHILQLALYRALLRELAPGKMVRAFLIHTAGPHITELPDEALEAALKLL